MSVAAAPSCTAARARHNTLIKLRLCQYSARLLDAIARDERIDYQAIRRGALYLYRDPALFEAGVQKMKLLGDHGRRQEVLDGAGVARLEPAFEPVVRKIAGAIRDVGDSSGDSRLFVEFWRVCAGRSSASSSGSACASAPCAPTEIASTAPSPARA